MVSEGRSSASVTNDCEPVSAASASFSESSITTLSPVASITRFSSGKLDAFSSDIYRLRVNDSLTNRDDQKVSSQALRPSRTAQREPGRYVLIVVNARLNLGGSVDLPVLREVVRYEVAVTVTVAARREPADQVLPLVGCVRQKHHELFLHFARQFHYDKVRLHLLKRVTLPKLLFGDCPQVFVIVEILRNLHMIADILFRLYSEQVLRVAHMGP